jgi:glutathione S-transferase
MKLFITPGSPYARMARIVVLEKALEQRVEVIAAQTRMENSPYYAINPSGRVPYLVRDDGIGMEDSAVICAWLDRHYGEPMFKLPIDDDAWEALRLEAIARSMLDGLSVWVRENARPDGERSPAVIRHEAARAGRMADRWEAKIEHPWMHGALNLAQITLGCALGLEARLADFRWRSGRPKLCHWFERIATRPSFARTAPASGLSSPR